MVKLEGPTGARPSETVHIGIKAQKKQKATGGVIRGQRMGHSEWQSNSHSGAERM